MGVRSCNVVVRVLVLAAIVSICSSPIIADTNLGVAYVANNGFLIEIGSKKILIEELSQSLSILFPGSRVFREQMQSMSFE